MHKERIIDGIEKVFEGYAKDEELREALVASNLRLELFPKYMGESHFLNPDGTIQFEYLSMGRIKSNTRSIRRVAEAYFDYFHFVCKSSVTLTKASEKLEEDLGARVEKLKKDYLVH